MSARMPVSEKHQWKDRCPGIYDNSVECRCEKCGAIAWRTLHEDFHWVNGCYGGSSDVFLGCEEVMRREKELEELGMSRTAHDMIYWCYKVKNLPSKADGQQGENWLDCIENYSYDSPMIDMLKRFKDADKSTLLDMLEFSQSIKPPKSMVTTPLSLYYKEGRENHERGIWTTYLIHKIKERRSSMKKALT